jgi:hypothetical protein
MLAKAINILDLLELAEVTGNSLGRKDLSRTFTLLVAI